MRADLANDNAAARFFSIVAATVVSLTAYGVIHDQVTVRMSAAYFTVAHPPVFRSASLALVALGWGVVAGASAGLPLGFVLAAAATNGRRNAPLTTRDLAVPLTMFMGAMATVAFLSGLLGYALGNLGAIHLGGTLVKVILPADQCRFLAARWAHTGTYPSGAVGAVVLILQTRRMRRRRGQGPLAGSSTHRATVG